MAIFWLKLLNCLKKRKVLIGNFIYNTQDLLRGVAQKFKNAYRSFDLLPPAIESPRKTKSAYRGFNFLPPIRRKGGKLMVYSHISTYKSEES